MKFALACFGSRGDVEPCVAVGRELLRRGHDVQMAVPPDLVAFTAGAGPAAVGFGPDVQPILDAHRDFWVCFFRNFWRVQDLIKSRRQVAEPILQRWDDICASLMSLAKGADVLLTGLNFEQPAANVAEHYGIPLATLHIFPHRANGQFLRVPAPVGRSAMAGYEWVAFQLAKRLDNAQRREMGLPKVHGTLPRRISERGWLEIQAYDEVCFPGLAAEWAQRDAQRRFVGPLALELPTDVDDEVASWIAAGKPPIFFGFGSIPVEFPAETFAMIKKACVRLGERALICSAGTDFGPDPGLDDIKIVGTMNYADAFPVCRAAVHHGGVGTTAASLRAGVPTLILSTDIDQTMWGGRVKRLKVGTARRLSTTTEESLVADLRTILAPEYAARARAVATQVTRPADSAAAAADLLEDVARRASQ